MTDQKQAPEHVWIDEWGGNWSPVSGGTQSHEFVRKDLHDAAIKQRDELAAKLKYHQHEVVDTHSANEADALARAEKAESERDELAANIERLHRQMQNIARHRDEIRAASAAREIAMRDRAASRLDLYDPPAAKGIRALPLSPDGQQALDDVRANAWDEGYDQALKDDFGSKGYTQNPYRKPSDAEKSEDRG